MPRSLAQIKQQIARLESEARAIEDKERGNVIKRIREAIDHYALTADDLFSATQARGRPRKTTAAKSRGRPRAAGPARKGGKVAPKYADGAGNTWTGRGSRPRWLVAALAEGKTLDQFAL